MKKQWLVRYSEIFLKSDPVRRQWENALIANIREVMPGIHVRNERGRIWLDGRLISDWNSRGLNNANAAGMGRLTNHPTALGSRSPPAGRHL